MSIFINRFYNLAEQANVVMLSNGRPTLNFLLYIYIFHFEIIFYVLFLTSYKVEINFF